MAVTGWLCWCVEEKVTVPRARVGRLLCTGLQAAPDSGSEGRGAPGLPQGLSLWSPPGQLGGSAPSGSPGIWVSPRGLESGPDGPPPRVWRTGIPSRAALLPWGLCVSPLLGLAGLDRAALGLALGLLHGALRRPSAPSADSFTAPEALGGPLPREAFGEGPRGGPVALLSLGDAARCGLGARPAWRGRSWGEAPGVWVRVWEAARGTGMEEA